MNAAPQQPIAPLTEQQQERIARNENAIRQGLAHFVEVGLALLDMHDAQLYQLIDRGDGCRYETFEEYYRGRWGLQHAHISRLMGAARVAAEMPAENQPQNERQARAYAAVPPEYRNRIAAALGDSATAAAIDRAKVELDDAVADDDDEEERRRKEREALDRWEAEHAGPAHRTQKSRLDKFSAYADQMERLIKAATDTEAAVMARRCKKLLRRAGKKAGMMV